MVNSTPSIIGKSNWSRGGALGVRNHFSPLPQMDQNQKTKGAFDDTGCSHANQHPVSLYCREYQQVDALQCTLADKCTAGDCTVYICMHTLAVPLWKRQWIAIYILAMISDRLTVSRYLNIYLYSLVLQMLCCSAFTLRCTPTCTQWESVHLHVYSVHLMILLAKNMNIIWKFDYFKIGVLHLSHRDIFRVLNT